MKEIMDEVQAGMKAIQDIMTRGYIEQDQRLKRAAAKVGES